VYPIRTASRLSVSSNVALNIAAAIREVFIRLTITAATNRETKCRNGFLNVAECIERLNEEEQGGCPARGYIRNIKFLVSLILRGEFYARSALFLSLSLSLSLSLWIFLSASFRRKNPSSLIPRISYTRLTRVRYHEYYGSLISWFSR